MQPPLPPNLEIAARGAAAARSACSGSKWERRLTSARVVEPPGTGRGRVGRPIGRVPKKSVPRKSGEV
jgi:hypothetical protein